MRKSSNTDILFYTFDFALAGHCPVGGYAIKGSDVQNRKGGKSNKCATLHALNYNQAIINISKINCFCFCWIE